MKLLFRFFAALFSGSAVGFLLVQIAALLFRISMDGPLNDQTAHLVLAILGLVFATAATFCWWKGQALRRMAICGVIGAFFLSTLIIQL